MIGPKRKGRPRSKKPAKRATKRAPSKVKTAVSPVAITDVDALLARWRKGAGADYQQVIGARIDLLAQIYASNGNATVAWQGFLLSLAAGMTTPQWVMDYLAVAAIGIFNLGHESAQGATPEPSDIARAIGMVTTGAGTAFPGPDEWDWVTYAVEVRDRIAMGDMETYAIGFIASEYNVSDSTVRRAWKRLESAVARP